MKYRKIRSYITSIIFKVKPYEVSFPLIDPLVFHKP